MKRLAAWPLFMCGFRPFFLAGSLLACVLMAAWLLMLGGAWPTLSMWSPPGGVALWHAYELVLGFGSAAVAGFLLTAVPEFTQTVPAAPRRLASLAVLWLLGRLAWLIAAWLPAPLDVLTIALPHLVFTASLLLLLLPSLGRDARARRHFSFALALMALLLVQLGFFASLLWHWNDPLAWVRLAVGLMMVLIILAGSRISMNVVNRLVELGKPGVAEHDTVGYLARPPRRNLAIFCICLCSAVEFWRGYDLVTAWLALAAAAAMLNLLNDWHVGRALFYRWALILYASYWLLALGYAAMGLSILGAPWLPSAGRHLLTVGAMGLSIFAVMNVAGRIHAGQWLDGSRWVPLAMAALVGAALLRFMAGSFGFAHWSQQLTVAAGLLWITGFAVYLGRNARMLVVRRDDGQAGCSEPRGQEEGAGQPSAGHQH